jgi:site-specific DNA-methyltransferase (adenine-specific)
VKPYHEEHGIAIYHGDSLEVLPALVDAGVRIGAIATDPPYSSGGAFRGDRAQATSSKYVTSGVQSIRPEFEGDTRDQHAFLVWSTLWLLAARQLAEPGALVMTFSDWRQVPTLSDALQCGGWIWRGLAPWSKKYGRPRKGGFSSACEFLIWGTNGPLDEHEAYPAGIVEMSADGVEDREHIAQKPEGVMTWALAPVRPGRRVCDPFMGTGTTLVAAKRLGLPAIGVDVMESNCEIAARRLSQGVLQLAPPADPIKAMAFEMGDV